MRRGLGMLVAALAVVFCGWRIGESVGTRPALAWALATVFFVWVLCVIGLQWAAGGDEE